MSGPSNEAERERRYDRRLLLGGPRRDTVLDLWEVERYGWDSYRDPDYVSLYGLTPSQWFARGVRLVGRTAVECTRDRLADWIGRDVAAVAIRSPTAETLVLDAFAGSGNTLYWMLRHIPGARGIGFELDPAIFEITKRNIRTLALPIDLTNADYRSGVSGVTASLDQRRPASIGGRS